MTGDTPQDGVSCQFDAVILAGGRAQRLGGTDKPGLIVAGRSLAAAVVSAAAQATTVIVVGPPRPELTRMRPGGRLRFTQEDPPGAGPLAALRRGIAEVSAPWLTVLAADLPFLRGQHLRHLLAVAGACQIGPDTRAARDAGPAGEVDQADEVGQAGDADRLGAAARCGAILIDHEGRPQWLVGCWRTTTLRDALRAYHGQSLRGLFAPLRPARVAVEPAGTPPPWLDCDSPEDLRRARHWRP